MKTYLLSRLSESKIESLCKRKCLVSREVRKSAEKIRKDVIKNGDDAIIRLTEKFDGVLLKDLKVNENAFKESDKFLSRELKEAILKARDNIWSFHEKQLPKGRRRVISKGIKCWQEFFPVEKAGLYIPAGTAPLFSTVLMLGIPAVIAGCSRIILCTPPCKEYEINPVIIWTAKCIGLHEIYKTGGAQAIFAMAYGTKQIPAVDKIFGPGNAYVTAAKLLSSEVTSIDMPAGPSELLVIADKTSDAEFVASDLLSQAEHGKDSQVVLVCTDKSKSEEILEELKLQLEDLPRKEIILEALKNSFVLIVENMEQALEFSNKYAPEHLVLSSSNYRNYAGHIRNAGSVFLGKFSSESFGDYASGTNHVLPTSGFARSCSGISVNDFMKCVSFQHIKREGLMSLATTVEIMSEKEELIAHKRAVSIRASKAGFVK
ncbi:MAG: histidinol dehydrogenase [Candidatus Coatesbacteria bacterium]|nr:histidinol dehydrogenase [Candidatus Coatesbacteria bacterium]